MITIFIVLTLFRVKHIESKNKEGYKKKGKKNKKNGSRDPLLDLVILLDD